MKVLIVVHAQKHGRVTLLGASIVNDDEADAAAASAVYLEEVLDSVTFCVPPVPVKELLLFLRDEAADLLDDDDDDDGED